MSNAMLLALREDAEFTRDRVGAPGSLVRQRAEARALFAEEAA